MDTTTFVPPLSEGVAYGIVLGFGVVFALCMNFITWISRKYLHESNDTQMLMTAKKSVKTGLVASAVVSSWCYAATILNSVRLTYVYGFAGLWWFCSGATCQIVCYAIMAIELKRRAPRANTILEAIRIRFGTSAHIVFFIYGVSVQILITAALLLGGSAALSVMTGASVIAMNYLIPFGVVLYTYLGGLKSTFLSDYIHTVVIFIIVLITMFKVMASSSIPILGSPGQLWDLLQPAALLSPAVGAKDGSYLTMDSGEGLLLAGVILVSGFGSVFVDPSYGQKAIAGEASAVVMGYFYGAFAWFSIPLGLCATMSFVAVVLQDTEYWPTSGGITAYQINNALILPLAAEAIMGTGGVVAIILMVFMAVTSSFSAEIVAHASIVTYDIYKPYINPHATDKQLQLVSHLSLAGFAVFSSSFATALNSSGVSMGWILEFVGVFVGSAVFPISLALTSSHVSHFYMTYAPPLGTLFGIAAWLGCTKGMYGSITIDTTFENWAMFSGCLASLMVPLLIWITMRPFTVAYDWDLLFMMVPRQPRAGDEVFAREDEGELGLDWDLAELARASFIAKTVSGVLCLVFLVLIPFPLYGTGYIMSRGFFTGWTVIVFIWAWCAALLILCLPIWQSREAFAKIFRGVMGRKKIRDEVERIVVEEVSDGKLEKS